MNIKKLLAFSSMFLVALMFSKIAHAEFGVIDNSEPCDVNASKLDYYGNAHTPKFRAAIVGDEEIPIEEQMEVEEKLPAIEYDLPYVRIRGHLLKRRVSKVQNVSSVSPPDSPVAGYEYEYASSTLTSVESHIKGIDLAIGYIWPDWRAELEYLFLKKIDYGTNTPLVSPAGDYLTGSTFASEIKTDALIGNFYYEFLQHDRLKPYLFFGIGLAVNKAATAYNGHDKTVQKLGIAWQAGAGVRFRIIDRLYIDGAFRHALLGRVLMYNDNAIKLKGNSSVSGVSVGLMFLI